MIKKKYHDTKINLVDLECIVEKKPLGTGGCLAQLKSKIKNEEYVMENNFKPLLNYSKFILIIICTYFIFENIKKIDWYIKRYDIWPPIYQENLINRKSF